MYAACQNGMLNIYMAYKTENTNRDVPGNSIIHNLCKFYWKNNVASFDYR